MAASEEVKDEVLFTNGHKYHRGCSALVKFTALDGNKLDSNDYIGLYVVGWTTIRDYYTYQYVIVPEVLPQGSVDLMLEFPASTLPKQDSDHFYQFVYVRGKIVVGTSLPFQLISPRTQVFVQKDEAGEDGDLVLVQTEEEALQEKVDHQKKQVEELKTELKRKKQLLANQSDVLAIQEEVTQQLEAGLKSKTQDLEAAVKRAESLTEELEHRKSKLENVREQARQLDEEREILTGQCTSLEQSLNESLIQHGFTQTQLTKCSADLADALNDNSTVQGEKMKLRQEVGSLKVTVVKMCRDQKDLVERLCEIAKDNSRFREALDEANQRTEGMSEMMTNQLSAQSEAKEMVKQELDKEKNEHHMSRIVLKGFKDQAGQLIDREKEYKCNIRSLECTLAQKVDEIDDKNVEIQRLAEKAEQDAALLQSDLEATQRTLEATKQEVASLKAKESAAVHAAAEEAACAREDLESVRRLAAVKGLEATALRQELEQALTEREERQVEPEVAELQKQVEDLKRRLKAGQKAYTKVFKMKEKLAKKLRDPTIQLKRTVDLTLAKPERHPIPPAADETSGQSFLTMFGNPYLEDIKRIISSDATVPTKQQSCLF